MTLLYVREGLQVIKDLTVGTPKTVLWKFCLPLFGSIIFQQLYNIADSWVAGKFIGENALAAVGNSYEITLIFIAFAFGCNMGCSVVTSQLFGAKQYNDMKSAVYTAIISSGVLCVILMVLGFLSADYLLQLIHTPQEIFADSKLYLDIYILGLPFLFFYNLATGIFSAMGDSKTPFIFLAISSTVNVGVNVLFVEGLKLGVAGVAWATFLCQGVSCVLAITVVLIRLARITGDEVVFFSPRLFRKFTAIAVPSILQQSSISIGNIMIQSAINDCGVAVTAGYAAAIKLNNLVITSFTTLGNGISNFAAQNIGANLVNRIKEGHKAGIQMVWTICVPIVLLYIFGAKLLVTFFISEPSELALTSGMHFLYIVAPFYFLISVKLVTDGIFRGTGMMKQFVFSTMTDLILRVVLVMVFVGPFGYIGIWTAWPLGWMVGTTLSLLFYRKRFGKNPMTEV